MLGPPPKAPPPLTGEMTEQDEHAASLFEEELTDNDENDPVKCTELADKKRNSLMQRRLSASDVGHTDALQQAMDALDAKHSAAVADVTSIFEVKMAEVREAMKVETNDRSSVECSLQAKCCALDRDLSSCRGELLLLRELVEAVEPKFTSSVRALRDAFDDGLSTQSFAHSQLRERLEAVCMDLGSRIDVALQQQEQSHRTASQTFEELDTRLSQLVQRPVEQEDVQLKPSLFGNCNRRLDQLEAELRNRIVNKISACETDIDDLRGLLAQEKQHCHSIEQVVESTVRAHAEDVKAIHSKLETHEKTNTEFNSKIRDVQQAIICTERDRATLASERVALSEHVETMEHVFSESAQQSAKAMEHAHAKLEEIKRRLSVCEGNSESFSELERKLATGIASQQHIATIHRRINDMEKALGEVTSESKTEFKAYHETIVDRLDTMDISLRDTADRLSLTGDSVESLRSQVEHESSHRSDDVGMLKGHLATEVQRVESLLGDLSQKCTETEEANRRKSGAFQGCEAELMQRLSLIETLVADNLKKQGTELKCVNNLVDELRDKLNSEQVLREAEVVEVRNCLGAEKSARSADTLSLNQRADYLENLITDEIAKNLSSGKESSDEARRLWTAIDGHMHQLSSQIEDMNSDVKERVTVTVPNPDVGGGPPGGDANNLDPRLASPPAAMKVLPCQPTPPCRWPQSCIASPVSPVSFQPSNMGGADRRAKAVEPIMSSPLSLDPSACVATPCQQQQPARLRSSQRPSQALVRTGSLSPASGITHSVVQAAAAVRVVSPARSIALPTMKMDLCSPSGEGPWWQCSVPNANERSDA
mmetsp:Transcript_118946/g.237081  ORF Transcript_118946/g.237081 Transcript_118946/m.237081 type:complete len:826 (+) Transcript_118946:55-2532(+)